MTKRIGLTAEAAAPASLLSERVKRRAEEWFSGYETQLVAWTEGFKANPAYSLSWSAPIFMSAARLAVAKGVLADLAGGATAERILKVLASNVYHKARWPESSTSVPSNEMSKQLTAAQAEFAAPFVEGE